MRPTPNFTPIARSLWPVATISAAILVFAPSEQIRHGLPRRPAGIVRTRSKNLLLPYRWRRVTEMGRLGVGWLYHPMGAGQMTPGRPMVN
jgi:hypothetical protein